MEFITQIFLGKAMVAKLYIKDALSPGYRMAIEARAQRAFNALPPSFKITSVLEERIRQANGFSSRCELLKDFDNLEISYSRNPNTFSYDFMLTVQDDMLRITQKLASKSGYSVITRPEHAE